LTNKKPPILRSDNIIIQNALKLLCEYVVTIDTLFLLYCIVLHFQRSKTIWDMVASVDTDEIEFFSHPEKKTQCKQRGLLYIIDTKVSIVDFTHNWG
jgi:hypothetical protein